MIATSRLTLGGSLRILFEHDESNSRLAKRILLLPKRGWEEFAKIDEQSRRHGMLRLLFTLRLIRRTTAAESGPRVGLALSPAHIDKALRLPGRVTPASEAITAFFKRNQDFAEAFHVALDRADIALPEWTNAIHLSRSPASGI